MNRARSRHADTWLFRAARAARDRLRSAPLVVQRRLVYAFDLRQSVPNVEPLLPLRYEIWPDPAEEAGASGGGGPYELLFRALAGTREVYRMRIGLRREELLHLLVGCSVPPRPIFLYDCSTDPEFRGKGIYPASLAYALRYGQKRGFDEGFIRVERRNVPSVIGIERAGFRPAAIVTHVSVFGVPVGPFGRAATWPPHGRKDED